MQTGIPALLGLGALFVGWVLTFVLPQIRYVAWGVLALGAILVLIAFVLDYRRVGGALASRRGKFSTGTTLMVSVFVGIILLVNAISIGNYHRFDVTGLSQYTLTSQTRDVLANLDQEVEVIKFFVPNDSTGGGNYATSLLEEYQNFTDKLKVKTVDPDEHPDQARQYGIDQYLAAFSGAYGVPAQVVAFTGESGRRFVGLEIILSGAEHGFTSAILEVTGTVQKRVYFVTGHNESSIHDTAPGGYSSAREGLLDNLYQVAQLDILAADAIPDDAAVLLLAAPSPDKPLIPREVELIQRYLITGGRMMILANPDSPPGLNDIVSPWGITLEVGTVVDPSSYTAPNLTSPSVPRTRNSFGLSTTYFPGATAVIPRQDMPEGFPVAIEPLVWTSPDGWLEKDYDPDVEPQFDDGADVEGPLAMGVLAYMVTANEEGEAVMAPAGTRLVVMGDSDFASNKHFFNGNNSDLFLNSVEYLTAGEELISIDRKFLQTRRLIIGPEAGRFITISSIGLLPLLVLLAGVYIWWRRR